MPRKAAAPAVGPESAGLAGSGLSALAESGTVSDTDRADEVAGLSFEQAITELEAIVDGMEGGELSLQDALASYQRGAALVGRCRQSLDVVAHQVRVLEEGLLKPMATDARGNAEDAVR